MKKKKVILTNIKGVSKTKLVNALSKIFQGYEKSFWKKKYDEEIESGKITIGETHPVGALFIASYLYDELKRLNKKWNSDIRIDFE